MEASLGHTYRSEPPMPFQKLITACSVILCSLAITTTAVAEDVERYDASFKKVVDNCDEGLALENASLVVTEADQRISVQIAELPALRGKAGKRGKLRADAKGTSKSLNVRYGLNGRISDDTLQAVFVIEYFKGKTPVCTQSYRVNGKRNR